MGCGSHRREHQLPQLQLSPDLLHVSSPELCFPEPQSWPLQVERQPGVSCSGTERGTGRRVFPCADF